MQNREGTADALRDGAAAVLKPPQPPALLAPASGHDAFPVSGSSSW